MIAFTSIYREQILHRLAAYRVRTDPLEKLSLILASPREKEASTNQFVKLDCAASNHRYFSDSPASETQLFWSKALWFLLPGEKVRMTTSFPTGSIELK